MNIAIVLAGGTGKRMNTVVPKQFLEINSKPLICYTLDIFEKLVQIDEIYIVCVKEWVDRCEKICIDYKIKKVKSVIEGGATRYDSTANAIRYLIDLGYKNSDKIVILNANQPLVQDEEILGCLQLCEIGTVATTVKPCIHDMFSVCTSNNQLQLGPERDTILTANTPEALSIYDAEQLYVENSLNTNEVYQSYTAGMLAILNNIKVLPFYGDKTNFKVTTDVDFKLVQIYLREKQLGYE